MNIFSGGKGLNQSVALGRAGAKVFHGGRIGKGGEFLVEQLKESGVNTDLVVLDEGCSTGHAIIQNDAEGDNCILLYGGANQRITKEQIDDTLSHFEAGDYVVLQNEINNLPYLMEKAAKKQMNIVLNPSPMDEKIKALPLDKVTLFFVNEIEAAQILGEKELESTEKAVEAFQDMFPKAAVVLTLGSAGSVYIDKDQVIPQKCYKVKAVDTTAAGDTFTGFLYRPSAVEKAQKKRWIWHQEHQPLQCPGQEQRRQFQLWKKSIISTDSQITYLPDLHASTNV